MGWEDPRTWVPGELVTAALLNTHLRDNLLLLKTSLDVSGKLLSLSSSYVAAPPLVYSDTTPVGNVGAGVDGLKGYTFAAGFLATNGWGVRVRGGGTTAANANNKQVGVYINGAPGGLTIASALNAKGWIVDVTIVRVDATHQEVVFWALAGYDNGAQAAIYQAGTQTMANTLLVHIVGVGVADNDVVQSWITAEHFRA